MQDSQLETSGTIIAFYERQYYCFSNFSSFAVEWRGRLWPTSEHAYQASRFMERHPEIVEEIFQARSAHDSKKLAEKYADLAEKDFHKDRLTIMEDICRHKLLQHSFIQKRLIQSGDKKIVEDSPKDNFWGWGVNRDGQNNLGKIWMKLRDELKNHDKEY